MEIVDKLSLVAEILEVDIEQLSLSSELETFDSWDSMGVLSILAMLEESFGKVDVSGNTIQSCKVVADLIDLME